MKAEPRRAVPMKLQRDCALALCANLMRKLGMVQVDEQVAFELDHEPALALRYVNPETGQHEPHQHDARFLVWKPKAEHRLKTSGRRGESDLSVGNGDAQAIAKVRKRDKKRGALDQASEPPAASRQSPSVKMRSRPMRQARAEKLSPCRRPAKWVGPKLRRGR